MTMSPETVYGPLRGVVLYKNNPLPLREGGCGPDEIIVFCCRYLPRYAFL